MNLTDKLNFRGKFRQYDVDGNSYLYKIGDSVEYLGEKYVAVKPTSDKIPGTIEGSTFWKSLGGASTFFIQETPPKNSEKGDRWYVPSTSILYTRVYEESNRFWVEL
jgi:hypothetical protein